MDFNVVEIANDFLGTNEYIYYKFKEVTVNESGYKVNSFYPPETRRAGIHPMPTGQYKVKGLDFNKHYILIYDTNIVNTLTRSSNPDEIIFDGHRYQLIHNYDWYAINGWSCVTAVRIDD